MTLSGWIDKQLSPRIKILLRSGIELEFVIDTGFNGEMVLPQKKLSQHNFVHRGSTIVELADGSKVTSELYEGIIIWFGKVKKVRVHATKSEDALLGTRMLIGYIFKLDVDENIVTITQKI